MAEQSCSDMDQSHTEDIRNTIICSSIIYMELWRSHLSNANKIMGSPKEVHASLYLFVCLRIIELMPLKFGYAANEYFSDYWYMKKSASKNKIIILEEQRKGLCPLY